MSDESIPTRTQKKKKQVHPGRRGPKYTIKQEELALKRNEALEFRKNGLSYPQIAVRMGISAMTAWRYVQDAIDDIPKERAIEVRNLTLAQIDQDLARLNSLHASTLKPAEVARVCLAKDRLRESKARLLGLNAPTAHEHTFLNHVDVRTLTDEQNERLAAGDFGVLDEASASGASARRDAEAGGAEGSRRQARTSH